MASNEFQSTVDSLFQGMNQFISSKSVVGDPIYLGDTIIVPLVDVSFAVGAGAVDGSSGKKNNRSGGLGGKVNPSAVLVITNGTTKMVNVKGADGLSRILDMLPDVVNKFTGRDKAESPANDIDLDAVEIE